MILKSAVTAWTVTALMLTTTTTATTGLALMTVTTTTAIMTAAAATTITTTTPATSASTITEGDLVVLSNFYLLRVPVLRRGVGPPPASFLMLTKVPSTAREGTRVSS